MVNPVNRGFVPLLQGFHSGQSSNSKQNSEVIALACPVDANELTGQPHKRVSGLSNTATNQPEEAGPVKAKPKAHGMRHEWKLVESRAGAKPQPEAAKAASFSSARDHLQHALASLKDRPHDRNRQEAAHDAQAALAQQPVPLGHRVGAVMHRVMRIGMAGSVQTFGIGRTLGVHVGTNAVPVGNAPGRKNGQRAVAQFGFGAVGGAIGNMVGQTLAVPVVDRLPKQFQPIDPTAVLPDRMLAKMNRIRSGWGDEMRAAVVERQKEILHLNSNTNVHFGEKAFSAVAFARALLQPPGLKPNLPQSVVLNSAACTLSGGAVGLNMGVNMARSVARVPRMETLDRVLASKPQERGEDAAMKDAQSLPLFYSHVTPASQRRSISDAVADSWHLGNLRDPAPAPWNPNDRIVYQNPVMRVKNMGADLRNLGQSVANRSGHLLHATAAPMAIATAQPFVVAGMPNDFSARTAGLVLPALAIKVLIRPWFNALTGGIPRHDAAMRAKRQEAVDADAASATQPKPAR